MVDEIRDYTVVGERSAFGRSTIDIRCPFCRHVTEAFVWSLAGSGKRCTDRDCRALFDGRGHAYKPTEPSTEFGELVTYQQMTEPSDQDFSESPRRERLNAPIAIQATDATAAPMMNETTSMPATLPCSTVSDGGGE